MKEDSGLNLKASDKFLHELLFIDRKNYFELKDADKLQAEAHARLSSPLLSLVMVLIAIYAVLGGDFSRRGYDRRIGFATGGALLVLAVQLAVQSEASNEPALNALQWIVPIATIIGLSYLYFSRGRHIGAAPARQRPSLSRNRARA
jgi:lipopolysaccharide export system permease protein